MSASTDTAVEVETSITLGAPIGRIPVTNVSPVIEGGAYPAKAVPGERIPVRATVFREGHDAVNASIVTTDPDGAEKRFGMHPTTPVGFDWWTGEFSCDREGAWTFRVEGWSGPVGDLGPQRRDQDPGRDRHPPGLPEGQCAGRVAAERAEQAGDGARGGRAAARRRGL